MSVDLQPHLVGELVELRPLRADDWDALFAVASDPLIWEQHPSHDRWKEDVFRKFFAKALDEVNCQGGAFAVIDRATQRLLGSTRYANHDPHVPGGGGEVEIGWTFLARTHWGGRYNTEMKRRLLDHAFRFVNTVYFIVGSNNIRSQKAMERIGGVRAGTVETPGAHGCADPQTTCNVKYVITKPHSIGLP
jgi:RimJ/RimL family protein N-acetyltransferase